MISAYPFLLIQIAGFLAGLSAILLRRASATLGRWLEIPALAAWLGAVGATAWAVYWAWTLAPPERPITFVESVAGWGLAIVAGLLAGWGLRARGWRVRREWKPARDETRQPYRTIRRPIALGVWGFLIGLSTLAVRPAMWVCTAAALVAWSGLLELADWDQRQRLPACRDYMRRTPRYLPLRGPRRSAE